MNVLWMVLDVITICVCRGFKTTFFRHGSHLKDL